MPLNLMMNYFFLAFGGLFIAGSAPYLAGIRFCSQFTFLFPVYRWQSAFPLFLWLGSAIKASAAWGVAHGADHFAVRLPQQ